MTDASDRWEQIKDRDPHDPLTQLEIMREKAEQQGCGVAHQYNVISQALARARELEAALERLIDAADPHMAAQDHASDPRCGLTQPITVAEGEELNNAVANARATITRLHAPPDSEPRVPEGWKLVPVEADVGMLRATNEQRTWWWNEIGGRMAPTYEFVAEVYRLMLAAAPQPQEGE